MELQKLNIMNQIGVKNRILNQNDKLSKLMLISIKYLEKPYHVLDDNGGYLGTLSKEFLSTLDYDFLTKDPTLLEVLNIAKIDSSIIFDFSPNIKTQIINHLMNSREDEVILIDSITDDIICITNKLMVSSLLGNDFFDKPYVRFGKQVIKYNNNLNKYLEKVNAQCGEDGIFRYIFEVIGTTSKYAIEFGGWDGIYLSNIRNLIIEQGFSGLFIEGDSEKVKDCINNYKDNDNVDVYEGFVGYEGDNTLDNILKKVDAPKEIDFLSIDIDGYDYHVWDAFKEYKPRVVIIEHNPSIPNDINYINPKSSTEFKGTSSIANIALGVRKGYSLIAVTDFNCIFVVNEEFEKFGILDNSLDNLCINFSLTENKFFQLYNKEIRYSTWANWHIWDGGSKFPSDKFTFL